MIFTRKNKSDINMKGKRIQRFLRKRINRAKGALKQDRSELKRVRAFVMRNLIPGRAHRLS